VGGVKLGRVESLAEQNNARRRLRKETNYEKNRSNFQGAGKNNSLNKKKRGNTEALDKGGGEGVGGLGGGSPNVLGDKTYRSIRKPPHDITDGGKKVWPESACAH